MSGNDNNPVNYHHVQTPPATPANRPQRQSTPRPVSPIDEERFLSADPGAKTSNEQLDRLHLEMRDSLASLDLQRVNEYTEELRSIKKNLASMKALVNVKLAYLGNLAQQIRTAPADDHRYFDQCASYGQVLDPIKTTINTLQEQLNELQ